ncbi:hypothetical protein JAAARDRAFT_50784 [Jaapia argillacea MUCL 33604]|uniref:HMG box domain-containing protein n=1 Tax=Jaapia argillacea MUCL 33604 TaxID=933084 RepID=A0A067P8W6_9AGAM|nr:hypothetical protein JAAARDRAFT_50784 [Jaapia argillacea MUCL 33604]
MGNPAKSASDEPAAQSTRRTRHDSLSGSESSGYSPYHQMSKADLDPVDDDLHAALIAQALNADGTPKRPMNAFMIFARKRRPEVSAANQTMRTGDISKILSKEWNSMDMNDKQFYLDQAKKLKDNFNSKYPDYVYRRRPNNSRKKRRTEGGPSRLADSASTLDPGEDFQGGMEWEEHSPGEVDESLGYPGGDLNYPRVHHASPSPMSDEVNYAATHSRVSSYPSYEPPANQYNSSAFPAPSIQASHSYHSHSQNQPAPHSLFTSEHGGGSTLWGTSTSGVGRPVHGRTTSAGWSVIPPLNIGGHHDASLGVLPSTKSEIYAPSRSWTSSASSASSGASNGPTSNPNLTFPTLNSSFYPQQPQSPGRQDDNTPHATSPHQYFSSAGHYSGRNGTHYEESGYAQPSSLHSSNNSGYLTSHHEDTTSRQSTLPQPLPSISTYALAQSLNAMTPSPASSGHSHLGFWDRDRLDGPP